MWGAAGVGCFQAAYLWPAAAPLGLGTVYALAQLGRGERWRQAFYPGLGVGLALSVLHLGFFHTIFGGGAGVLWLVYAFWLGLFAVLVWGCFQRLPGWLACGLVPFLWVGLEYFRSELYYLRFSWVTPTLGFYANPGQAFIPELGVFGSSFLLAAVAAAALWPRPAVGWWVVGLGAGGLAIWGSLGMKGPGEAEGVRTVRVAGVQMEFPTEGEVLARLRALLRQEPEVDLVVLSEYTFNGAVPERVKRWCRENRRYLMVGATDPLPGGNYYNTAFVIGPDGEVVFRQVKAVPIQFFKDGLPAPEQRVWDSPWGKLGICICYDLSYTRVTDPLIRQGAEALIVPTMDVMDWGVAQHELHGRVAPVRAAEYRVPIFRLASSGVSQAVDAQGRELGRTPCPGDGAILSQRLELRGAGRVPPDRGVAVASVVLAALVGCGLTGVGLAEKLRHASFFRKRDVAGGLGL